MLITGDTSFYSLYYSYFSKLFGSFYSPYCSYFSKLFGSFIRLIVHIFLNFLEVKPGMSVGLFVRRRSMIIKFHFRHSYRIICQKSSKWSMSSKSFLLTFLELTICSPLISDRGPVNMTFVKLQWIQFRFSLKEWSLEDNYK